MRENGTPILQCARPVSTIDSSLYTAEHECFLSCIFSAEGSESTSRKRLNAASLSSIEGSDDSTLSSVKKSLIIGIDPGISGAVGIIKSGKKPKFLAVFDMPTKEIGGKKRLDLELLALMLETYAPNCSYAIIEKVGRIPTKADPLSSFVFGFATGAPTGILAAHGIKVQTVAPNVWKPALGLDKDKRKSLKLAKKFFPEASEYLKRVKDHDRAEALLMAYFANSLGGLQ